MDATFAPTDEECPDCGTILERKADRHSYIKIECPECGKWKRPGWDELREVDWA